MAKIFDISSEGRALAEKWGAVKNEAAAYILTPEDKAGAALELIKDNLPEARAAYLVEGGAALIITAGAVWESEIVRRLLVVGYIAGYSKLIQNDVLRGLEFNLL